MAFDEGGIRAYILRKLARFRKWGASHTSFDNLQSGVPPHLRDKAKEEGRNLIREGFLLQKEIKDVIEKYHRDMLS